MQLELARDRLNHSTRAEKDETEGETNINNHLVETCVFYALNECNEHTLNGDKKNHEQSSIFESKL